MGTNTCTKKGNRSCYWFLCCSDTCPIPMRKDEEKAKYHSGQKLNQHRVCKLHTYFAVLVFVYVYVIGHVMVIAGTDHTLLAM